MVKPFSINISNQIIKDIQLKVEKFPWLYVDYEKLEEIAFKNKLHCEKMISGENYDYLAKITKVC